MRARRLREASAMVLRVCCSTEMFGAMLLCLVLAGCEERQGVRVEGTKFRFSVDDASYIGLAYTVEGSEMAAVVYRESASDAEVGASSRSTLLVQGDMVEVPAGSIWFYEVAKGRLCKLPGQWTSSDVASGELERMCRELVVRFKSDRWQCKEEVRRVGR